MTLDIDMVLHIDLAAADRLIGALASDYFVDDLGIKAEIRRQGMFNLVHKATAIRIDCIVRQDSPYRIVEFDRRQRLEMGGFEAYVITIEDLILSKLIWTQQLHSEKQLQDICLLLQTGRADLDYLRLWAGTLRLDTFGLLMNTHPDAHAAASQQQWDLIIAMTPAQRFQLGMRWIEMGWQLMEARIRAEQPGIQPGALAAAIFERCYGHLYPDEQKARILASILAAHAQTGQH